MGTAGPTKLPELGKELGKTVKSFQNAAKVLPFGCVLCAVPYVLFFMLCFLCTVSCVWGFTLCCRLCFLSRV